MHRLCGDCTYHRRNWKWMALHYPRSGQFREQLCNILHEGLWLQMEEDYGCTIAYISSYPRLPTPMAHGYLELECRYHVPGRGPADMTL